jgi:DNA-binding CsgD family transcriptional regulator/PAS domain-containing protein
MTANLATDLLVSAQQGQRAEAIRMPDPVFLSDLIGDIYDAALDQSLWSGAIERCTHFVGGAAAALFSKDATANSGNVYHDFGTDPHYVKLYFEEYVKLDPSTTGHFFAELEEPVAVSDLMPYDEFLATRFYLEWARPQGFVDFVGASLDKSATDVAMFGVFRHERDGVVDDETRARMRLIVPHIRRSVLIGKVFNFKTAEAASFSDTLDGLSYGVFLVDRTGRIVHANAAGCTLLSVGDPLRAAAGRLVLSDATADQTLREAFAALDQGDAALGVEGIAVSLPSRSSERYVAHVLPLTSGARRRTGIAYTAVAALFVRKAALETPLLPQVISRTYNLTPTELRVLLAIVEIGGAPEAAEALGIAVTTVKTHLRRLYAKTGVVRHADLVKLVAGFSTPLQARQ